MVALIQSGKVRASLATAGYAIGAMEASRLAEPTFRGQAVDADAIVLDLTRLGDANLSGTVDFDDLLALAQNYGAGTGKSWADGDFDYSGTVDFDDLLGLAQNYNLSANVEGIGTGSFAADWALAQSLVPEPTSLAVLGVGLAAVRRRR